MPPRIALYAFCAFIVWLLISDRKGRSGISGALWIPVIWTAILASRPISLWLGVGTEMTTSDDYVEGSSLDRNFFLLLLISGCVVLFRRGASLQAVISHNRWIFLFYLYFGLSVFWSDYPFVSFKRWIKDLGNVVMVLVMLTEQRPAEAVRAVFTRCACVLIPVSVLVIKYFPEIGRSYDRWTGRQFFQGVALSKNSLGATVTVLSLFVVWELLQVWGKGLRSAPRLELGGRLLLLGMAIWLLSIADSVTSIACTILGAAGLTAITLPVVRKRLQYTQTALIAGAVGVLLLSAVVDVGAALQFLGRDPTLTGRTDIWQLVLAEKTDPLLGTGFYSFWLGPRTERFWAMYAFRINQAHNGYLETYLNGGIIGVALLVIMLLAAGRAIQKYLVKDPEWGGMRFVFWLMVLIHNWTEASFTRLNILWLVLLVVMMEYSRKERDVHFP